MLYKALAAGFGTGSRRNFIFLCQTLWAKSPEEAAHIEDEIQKVLPKELDSGQLNELLTLIEESVSLQDANHVSTDAALPEMPNPDQPAQKKSGETIASSPKPETIYEPQAAIRFDKSPEPADFNIPMPAIRSVPLNQNLDFNGQMPVSSRQMKRAWRYFRRMQRVGAPTELDVSATLKRIYQQGILLQPVLIPRRTNLARMLILADAGGSMAPFHRMVNELINSASHSGLAKIGAFYFHDVAQNFLYRDAGRTEPEAIEDVLMEFTGAGILIISDGGAARGNYDERRVEQTASMIKMLRGAAPNIAWLNPSPKIRWAGTTADAILRKLQVPMYPFDRPGLDAAVEALRGRGIEEYKG